MKSYFLNIQSRLEILLTITQSQNATEGEGLQKMWMNMLDSTQGESTMRAWQQVVGWCVERDSENGCGSVYRHWWWNGSGRFDIAPNWLMIYFHPKKPANFFCFWHSSSKINKWCKTWNGLKGLLLSTQRHSSFLKLNSCRLVLGRMSAHRFNGAEVVEQD